MAKEKETQSGATEEHKATQLNIFKEKKITWAKSAWCEPQDYHEFSLEQRD